MRPHHLFASLALAALSASAHADSFDLTFGTAASAFSGYGVLTTGEMVAPTEYKISSITGVVIPQSGGASAIKSLLAPGTFPTPTNGGTFPANDDILFVAGGSGTLTENGLSFLLRNGSQINLYEDGGGFGELLTLRSGANILEAEPITIKAVATPEPSSFALLGTGLLAAAGVARRRFVVPLASR